MSAAATEKLSFGECVIRGRVEASRRYEGKTYTRLVQPSLSAYDKPSVNEIVSASSIGAAGDEITVRVRVAGYPRKPYDFTDRKTGEVRVVHPVDNLLIVVE